LRDRERHGLRGKAVLNGENGNPDWRCWDNGIIMDICTCERCGCRDASEKAA
jgi:hypothetical protein